MGVSILAAPSGTSAGTRPWAACTTALLALLAMALPAGESGTALDQAQVVLKVRDGRWVDREATRFAAAYGGDLAGIRGELARMLFRTSSFDGIDLSRPSLLAWREGNAPLVAVIPISNRAAFLSAFGTVDDGEPPMVRTGERDGTVIYRQNQPGGEWEYRLLVAGSVAYLARTAQECQRLASAIGQLGNEPTAAPLELIMRGDALRAPRLPGANALASLPPLPFSPAEFASVPALAVNAWSGLSEQLASISIQARSDAQGNLLLNARFTARADTSLASWISAQRPGTERLASQLRSPDTAILVSGRLSFQGQAERWAFEQADELKSAAGARWNDAADGAYRGLCTLIERTGAFAVSVDRRGTGLVQSWVAEHPRAFEVVQSAASVFAALHGGSSEQVKLGSRSATLATSGTASSLFIAGDRHAARLDDKASGRAVNAAGDLMQRLDESGSLDAAPALLLAWIDLGRAWGAPPPAEGIPAEQVVVRGMVRPSSAQALDVLCEVPLAGMGRILGRMHKTTKND